MENPSEHIPKQPSQVTFLNEPRVSEDPKVKEKHEERMLLAGKIESFLTNHEVFKEKEVTVQFAQDGVASLICIVDISQQKKKKVVLKIPFGGRPTYNEAIAFSAWKAVGASVPTPIEKGVFDDTHQYLLMDCIDAPTLEKAYTLQELIEKELFVPLGELLATMHRNKRTGFGSFNSEEKAEFTTFADWLQRKKMKEDSEYVVTHGLMETQSIEKASALLAEYSIEHPETVVCHLDFAANNVFATTPFTVFDAAPEFNLPHIDIGKSIVNMNSDGAEAIGQFMRGYEEASGVLLNKKLIQAAVVLMMIRKLANSHKTGGQKMEERIARNKKYLADNDHLLYT